MKKTRILLFVAFLVFGIIKLECFTINKVVIPAAGLGTRLLPGTKTTPKELYPLSEKPAIQIVVEEAMHAGITTIIPIVRKSKTTLIDFFNPLRNTALREAKKEHLLDEFHQTFGALNFSYVYQNNPQGLGHAVMLAQPVVDNEYFGVILPDDIIFAKIPALQQLAAVAQREQATVISVQEVPAEDVYRYGVISIKQDLGNGLYEVGGLVEKPPVDQAPSRLAINGRYILSPKIFESLSELYAQHTTGELQLTDAIAHMMKHKNERVLAYKIDGERHDIGVPLGWIKGVIANALHQEEYRTDILGYLNEKVAQYQ